MAAAAPHGEVALACEQRAQVYLPTPDVDQLNVQTLLLKESLASRHLRDEIARHGFGLIRDDHLLQRGAPLGPNWASPRPSQKANQRRCDRSPGIHLFLLEVTGQAYFISFQNAYRVES